MVHIWERAITTAKPEKSPDTVPVASFPFDGGRVESVTFSPDGKSVVFLGSNNEPRRWGWGGEECSIKKLNYPFEALQFSSAPGANQSWTLTEMGTVPVDESEPMPDWAP